MFAHYIKKHLKLMKACEYNMYLMLYQVKKVRT